MKAAVCVPFFVLVVCLMSSASGAGEKKELKCDMGYLEKTWGLKYKSHEIQPTSLAKGKANLRILLEFTKDVEDLKGLRHLFDSSSGEFRKSPPTANVWFYYFDEDNVSLGKAYAYLQGDLTGKKGDAIRITLPLEGEAFKKARKVEARPDEKVKTDSKGSKKEE